MRQLIRQHQCTCPQINSACILLETTAGLNSPVYLAHEAGHKIPERFF